MALRYLRARKKERMVSVITVTSFLGILLGVATLIVVMSVMNGFRIELLRNILAFSGHIAITQTAQNDLGLNSLRPAVEALPQVETVMPFVEGNALATSPQGRHQGVLIKAYQEKDFARLAESFEFFIKDDDSQAGLAANTVIIGAKLAQALGVRLGDSITLLSPKGIPTPFGTAPKAQSFPITGLFKSGLSTYDTGILFMELQSGQRFLGMEGRLTALDVRIKDADDIDSFKQVLQTTLPQGSLRFHDWRQANSSIAEALEIERAVMFFILTLILLVASMNMVSALVMMVRDKRKDIAVLRTMGMSRYGVTSLFFTMGVTVGLLGTVGGLALGTAFCFYIEEIRQFFSGLIGMNLFSPEIYFLSKLPAIMDGFEVLYISLMALSLSCVATLYPAMRAARLDPVEVLRYE